MEIIVQAATIIAFDDKVHSLLKNLQSLYHYGSATTRQPSAGGGGGAMLEHTSVCS